MFANRLLSQQNHRPWPLPDRAWVMSQVWLDLLFMHWPIPVSELAALIPAPLQLDLYQGQAWIGVVPFRMAHVKPRGAPSVPGLSFFPELNVRTYVTDGNKSGVWFFSLDAAQALAVKIARRVFHLPYFQARMKQTQQGHYIRYDSHRIDPGGHPADLQALYRPRGPVFQAQPGSLEHWLCERYCLYAQAPNQQVYRGEIHHQPWPLQVAEADIHLNTMTLPIGIHLPPQTPLLHFAKKLEVVVWGLQRL